MSRAAESSNTQAAKPEKVGRSSGGCGVSKSSLGLTAIVLLQVFSLVNFESSASYLQTDLEASQMHVHQLQAKLAAVEHAAMSCYKKLNTTEMQVAQESEIINDETRFLRNLTAREQEEQMELKALRTAVEDLNATVAKGKIALRYEMEERRAAERAAQASQNGVQVIKDQLLASQDELKTYKERCNKEAAKAHRKLGKAEKKAKDEERARAKYMEGMLALQSKLGQTKSLLDASALSASGASARHATSDPDQAAAGLDEDGGGGAGAMPLGSVLQADY